MGQGPRGSDIAVILLPKCVNVANAQISRQSRFIPSILKTQIALSDTAKARYSGRLGDAALFIAISDVWADDACSQEQLGQ